jgi:CTP:molybdopterin cytidylyltransferase MocA
LDCIKPGKAAMAAAGAMLQLPAVTAVLLAGSAGSKMYPLNASGTPKVLLPVANRPLLTFPLRMLEESGIEEVLVVRCWGSSLQTGDAMSSEMGCSCSGEESQFHSYGT